MHIKKIKKMFFFIFGKNFATDADLDCRCRHTDWIEKEPQGKAVFCKLLNLQYLKSKSILLTLTKFHELKYPKILISCDKLT